MRFNKVAYFTFAIRECMPSVFGNAGERDDLYLGFLISRGITVTGETFANVLHTLVSSVAAISDIRDVFRIAQS